MMSRLGFCCDHACVQASAITIAATREMRLIHRAIRKALNICMQSSSLFYNPKTVRWLLHPGFRKTWAKNETFETRRNRVSGGTKEPRLATVPPFPPFLHVSKVLVFCYLAGFPTIGGGCHMNMLGSLCLLVLCIGIWSHQTLAQSPVSSS